MNKFAGKAAVVTSGVGAAKVRPFVPEDRRVVVADRDREAGEARAVEFGADARLAPTDLMMAHQQGMAAGGKT